MSKFGFNLCNFIEITLRHGCSPVNLWHIFRTPFCKNTYGGLPRNYASEDNSSEKPVQNIHNLSDEAIKNIAVPVFVWCPTITSPNFQKEGETKKTMSVDGYEVGLANTEKSSSTAPKKRRK